VAVEQWLGAMEKRENGGGDVRRFGEVRGKKGK
jgi:hypothetical protein